MPGSTCRIQTNRIGDSFYAAFATKAFGPGVNRIEALHAPLNGNSLSFHEDMGHKSVAEQTASKCRSDGANHSVIVWLFLLKVRYLWLSASGPGMPHLSGCSSNR